MPDPWDVAVVPDAAIWIGVELGELIVRVDVRTHEISKVSPPFPVVPIAGSTGLWLLGPVATQNAVPSTLFRVDEDSLELTAYEFETPVTMAPGDEALWVLEPNRLLKLDPRTMERLVSVQTEASDVAWACGSVWLTADATDEQQVLLRRVDQASAVVVAEMQAPRGTLHESAGRCWYVAESQLFEVVEDELVDTGILRRQRLVGDGFWSLLVGNLLQRFDPVTLTTVGPRWALDPNDLRPNVKGQADWQLIDAGRSLWVLNRDQLIRYDIPTESGPIGD